MKKLLLFAFVLILAGFYAKASHVAGGEFTYECIGGNDYKIVYTFYRDCSGVAAPTTITASFSSPACGQNFSITLNPIVGTGQEITPVCPTQATTCAGGTLFGMRKWVYEGIVTLMPCPDWFFQVSINARNPITNVSSSGSLYLDAHLDNSVDSNSAPVFVYDPVNIFYANQTYCVKYEATDIEGDSLAYSLIAPKTSATGTVTYTVPFTYLEPLTSSTPITLNSLTGELCMTPTQVGNTVVAVQVDEYRNGVKIGSIIRDLQVYVITSNNNLPELAGINLSATQYDPNDTIYTMTVFAGGNIDFDIFSLDADTGKLFLIWNNGIPTGSFTVTNQNTDSAFCNFQWMTSLGDTLNSPYCFNITIQDDNCPYIGTQVFRYCFNVIKYVAGIPGLNSDNIIAVYPNPSNGIFNILVKGYANAIDLSVININGQVVYNEELGVISNYTKRLDMSTYPKGVYFLKIMSEEFVKVEKIVVQ